MANYQAKNEKSRELDTGKLDINLDGWKFNVAKFYHEFIWCCIIFTNIVTENFRCAPYLWAHVVLFAVVILLAVKLWGAG